MLQKEPETTNTLGKVRNFQCEQNRLESLAIDGDSPVRQVLETLYLQIVCCEFTSVNLQHIRLSSRSGHEKP